MDSQSFTYIAIDVAKKSHTVFCRGKTFDISNDQRGFEALKQSIQQCPSPLVVIEATGGYERPIMRYLRDHHIHLTRVNPARVRHFAASEGQKAKSDPADAKLLAQFAQEKKLRPDPTSKAHQEHLAELMDRRDQLTEHIAREKNRLEKQPRYARASIERILTVLEDELSSIENQIKHLIDQQADLKEHSQIIQSVCGIGKVTAWAILAYLPEITLYNRNQIVSLAGIAPFDKDSGSRKGKRTVQGGRAKVRKALYMAAQTAAMHNNYIIPYAKRLKDKGKPYKCVMVAIMRKLLLHIQSLLKKHQLELAS